MTSKQSRGALGCVVAAVVLPLVIVGGLIYGRMTRARPTAPPAISTAPAAHSFGGYRCTQDCSGHEAGYAWAQEHGIMDSEDCPDDDGQSFMEGCVAYAEQADDSPYVDRP